MEKYDESFYLGWVRAYRDVTEALMASPSLDPNTRSRISQIIDTVEMPG